MLPNAEQAFVHFPGLADKPCAQLLRGQPRVAILLSAICVVEGAGSLQVRPNRRVGSFRAARLLCPCSQPPGQEQWARLLFSWTGNRVAYTPKAGDPERFWFSSFICR